MKLFLFGVFMVAAAPTEDPSNTGLQWMEKVYERNDGKDAISRVKMTLQKVGSKKTDERLFVLYRHEPSHGENHSLLCFLEPASVAKTSLLTKDARGDQTDQWLFIPALKRSKRIVSDRKGGRFVGSDFFYEDIRDREPRDDQHTLLGEDEISGRKMLKIESKPIKESVYSKRISWIDPALLIPTKIDFYDEQGNLWKQLEARRIKQVDGIWTVMSSVMIEFKEKHQTTLDIQSIQYNQDLAKKNLFTVKSLENPQEVCKSKS